MFTFHWSELVIVIVCGLLLFWGLALVMLRRRNEILKDFLTPEDPNLEEEFFRVRRKPKEEEEELEEPVEPGEETGEEQPGETAEMPSDNTVQWGAVSEQV